MTGILNNFLHHVIKMKREVLAKIWAFLEKNYGLLFFRFYNCGPFEGGPGAIMSQMPSFLMRPCWDPQLFLKLNTFSSI